MNGEIHPGEGGDMSEDAHTTPDAHDAAENEKSMAKRGAESKGEGEIK
jgi:hypothetical protein